MAEYRQIHTSIWKDSWFLDLEPDEKLLFVYLFSNESTSVAGIYKIATKVIAFETGLGPAVVKSILERFAKAGKVLVEGEVIWVKNLRKYNATRSPKVSQRIARDLEDIPDCAVKRAYLAFHDGIAGQGSDTVPIPYPELASEQEQEHEHEQEQIESPADAAPDGAPLTFPQWQQALKDADHRGRPDLVRQFMQAYLPNNELPAHSYIAKTAKDVGGWGRLLDLLWQQVPRPPTGDALAFVRRVHEHRGNGRDSPRAERVPLERHVADIPKGSLQEPPEPDEEPEL